MSQLSRITESIGMQPQQNSAVDLNGFFQMTKVIQTDIDEFKKRIGEVENCQSDLVLSGGRNQDATKKLDTLYQQMSTLNAEISRKLQDLKKVVSNSPKASGTQANIMQNQFSFLQQSYKDHLTRYQQGRQTYLQKMRDNMTKKLSIVGQEMTEDQMDNMIDEGQTVSVFTADYQKEAADARRMFEEVSTRHDEILRIEKTLMQLRDMFVEVAMLIEEQGVVIDRIEANTAAAQIGTEKSGEQLGKALVLKKKSRRCCICIVVTVIVIVVIIAIILTVYFLNKYPPKS